MAGTDPFSSKAGEDPNDKTPQGSYKDDVDEMSMEQKSVLVNFPEAPDKKAFQIKGGGDGA